MQRSAPPEAESSVRSRAWSNPYKFRLWFSNQNTDMFNDRQKRMVYHFLSWGPRGCDSWNYRLELEFHCSKRTIRNDLRHLEKHALIVIRGALGKHRRIIAIPYPNRATWMQISFRQTSQKLGEFWSDTRRNRGAKFCPHQRRLTKSKINQGADELLYGESFFRFSGGGSSETSASDIPYEERQIWEQYRRKLIDQRVRTGCRRESAIAWANTVVRISIKQRRANVTKAKQKTPTSPEPETSPPS